jgi:hypothetical protein
MLGLGYDGPNRSPHLIGSARGQDVAASLGHAGKDGGNLGGRLACGEDNFRHSSAQGAMVVELGEAEVFEGQVLEAIDGIANGSAPVADFVEESFEAKTIHFKNSYCGCSALRSAAR